MSIVNGTFALATAPGRGTTLRGEIPLNGPEDAMADAMRIVIADDNYLVRRAPAACWRTPAR
jgi:hypothetical protein